MEGNNFVLPGTKRVPSMFAAGCMYFLAVAGKLVTGYFGAGLEWLLRRLWADPYWPKPDLTFITPLVTLLYYLCFILLPLVLYARRHPGIGEYIRLKPPDGSAVLAGIAMGIVGFFLCLYASYLWCLLIEALGGTIPDSGTIKMDSTAEVIAQLAITAILPAVCEELLFRGALLSAWEEKGTCRAILIVALLFTLVHSRIAGVPAEFISGLILAYLVVITGSLVTGIIYHTVHNSMALIMTRLSAGQEQTVKSYYEAIGGAAGVAVLAVRIAIAAGIAVLILKFLSRRNGRDALSRPAVEGEPKGVCDWLVILCGVIFAAALYVPDILTAIGVL